jgi:hypothetical protein
MSEDLKCIYALVPYLKHDELLQLASYVWDRLRGDQQITFLLLHDKADAETALLEACKRIVTEDAAGEISIGAIEDCQSALRKVEDR